MYILNLFISNDDTTTTFYNDYYDHSKTVVKDLNSNNLTKNVTKLNDICSNLIQICEKLDDKKYFLVILSCYAKMKELEKALFKISLFKGLFKK